MIVRQIQAVVGDTLYYREWIVVREIQALISCTLYYREWMVVRIVQAEIRRFSIIYRLPMNFPLFVPTYEINGRIYRRNIQGILRNEYEVNFGTSDTADLYGESDSCNSAADTLDSSDETTSMTSESSNLLTTDVTDETDDQLKRDEEFVINYNTKTKKWTAKIKIPVPLWRFVIGPKGSMKKKIEEETSCRLNFPVKKKKRRPI
ncbi:unnamed protein product, partial [Acanthocheilonema viteae]